MAPRRAVPPLVDTDLGPVADMVRELVVIAVARLPVATVLARGHTDLLPGVVTDLVPEAMDRVGDMGQVPEAMGQVEVTGLVPADMVLPLVMVLDRKAMVPAQVVTGPARAVMDQVVKVLRAMGQMIVKEVSIQ